MSIYTYACTDPKNKFVHVGQVEFMSGVKEGVIVQDIKLEHPGCGDVILLNVDGKQEGGIDVALDLDGVCYHMNVQAYDTSRRRFCGEVYTLDLTANLFLRHIGSMLTEGVASVMDISPDAEDSEEQENMIGYVDALNYYFMPNALFDAALAYRDGKEQFGWLGKKLYMALRKLNIVKQIGGDGKTTRMKRTPDGKIQRLLWIPRQYIEEMMML